jgi:hypothetical protein
MTGNAFSEVTDSNHAGVTWIIALLCLVYSVLTYITRGFIKWHMLGWDDLAITIAQVLAIAQYVALFVSLKNGLGRTSEMLTGASRALVSKTAFASQLLTIMSLCLSKCSIILLIRRVFTRDLAQFWLICNMLLAFSVAWAVASIILVTVGCSSSTYIPPRGDDSCVGLAVRWDVVVALDVFTEFVMIVLPIYFLWSLQMSMNLKARVVIAFAFRLPVAAFAMVFARLFTTVHKSPNPGVAVATAISWQQIQLSYSLISATIPCLKSFIKSFDTNFGHGDGSSTPAYYGSHHSGTGQLGSRRRSIFDLKTATESAHTESIKLNNFIPRKSNGDVKRNELYKKAEQKTEQEATLRPEKVKNSITISGGDEPRPDSRGSGGSRCGSHEMIIRRDVHFQVQHSYIKVD